MNAYSDRFLLDDLYYRKGAASDCQEYASLYSLHTFASINIIFTHEWILDWAIFMIHYLYYFRRADFYMHATNIIYATDEFCETF